MRIGVIHRSLNPRGGAERVCISTIEALKESGHEVTLLTIEKTDWLKVRNTYGEIVKPDKELLTPLLPFKLEKFSIYQLLVSWLALHKFRTEYDLLINTHGNAMPAPCDIVYLHYPIFATIEEKCQGSFLRPLYYIPYAHIYNNFSNLYFRRPIILTNSSFSQKVIMQYAHKRALIVYPPVDTSKFYRPSNCNERKNLVVTCSRFAFDKQLHFIPRVAKNCPALKFKIFGSSGACEPTISKIKREMQKNNVSNVEIITNASLNKLVNLYSKAKIYLHTAIAEPFGISVVEAMASGLVPVVRKSGGTWSDVLENGKYGFGYITEDEASATINSLAERRELFHECQRKAQERSKMFCEDEFKRKMIKTIEIVANNKGIIG